MYTNPTGLIFFMKLKFLTVLAFFCITLAQAQYASFEASTGGFSFIPAFTSEDPHIIVNAGTTDSKPLSFHLLSTVRMSNFTPRALVFMSRYKFINKKLKASIGIHLPALQISDDYQVDSFFAQEFIASYPLSKKLNIGLFYLHGEGKNLDFEVHFLAFNTTLTEGKFSFLTQLYALDINSTYGISETISYKINKNIDLRGFANKTLSDGKFNWTIGARYNL